MLVSVLLKQSFSPTAVGRQKTRPTSRSNHPSAQAGGREAALHCCQLQALIHASVLHPGQPDGVQRLWKQGSGPRAGICVLHPCWAQHHRRGEWNLSFKTRAKWWMQIAITFFCFCAEIVCIQPLHGSSYRSRRGPSAHGDGRGRTHLGGGACSRCGLHNLYCDCDSPLQEVSGLLTR